MPCYQLYNKEIEKDFVHPKIGLWHSTDLELAREMRDFFRDYLKRLDLPKLAELIIIKDVDSNLEID